MNNKIKVFANEHRCYNNVGVQRNSKRNIHIYIHGKFTESFPRNSNYNISYIDHNITTDHEKLIESCVNFRNKVL